MKRKFSRREPTIALINIVFLMLIFFMITGTIAKPIEKTLRLIETEKLLRIDLPDALVLHQDGTIKFNGDNIKNLQIFVSGNHIGKDIRIVPDRNLPANELVKITKELKNFGAKRVFIVTDNLVQ